MHPYPGTGFQNTTNTGIPQPTIQYNQPVPAQFRLLQRGGHSALTYTRWREMSQKQGHASLRHRQLTCFSYSRERGTYYTVHFEYARWRAMRQKQDKSASCLHRYYSRCGMGNTADHKHRAHATKLTRLPSLSFSPHNKTRRSNGGDSQLPLERRRNSHGDRR